MYQPRSLVHTLTLSITSTTAQTTKTLSILVECCKYTYTCTNPTWQIQRNIGNALVRSGQYQEAVDVYEQVMEETPDHQTTFNLLVSYYALGQVRRGMDGEMLDRWLNKL